MAHWKQNSGVSPSSGVAIEFGIHMTTLGHMACIDQYNLFHSAGAEMLARRQLTIMRAVKRNPRAEKLLIKPLPVKRQGRTARR